MYFYNLTTSSLFNKLLQDITHGTMSNKLDKIYMFGSAVWKIPMKIYNPINDDIDLLFELKDIDTILTFIKSRNSYFTNGVFSSFNLKKINNNHDLYSIINSTIKDDDIHHYELIVTDDATKDIKYKLDLIFVSDIDKFINSMSDFDCGMLLYSFSYKSTNYFVGGTGGILKKDNIFDDKMVVYIDAISIKQIIQSIKDRIIEFNFFDRNNLRTTFYRLHKLLKQGFTIDCKKYSFEILTLFNKSFCLTPQKYNSKHQIMFYENCINKDDHNIIKQAFNNFIVNPSNEIIDQYIAYCLTVGDFDEAVLSVKHYYFSQTEYFKLIDIPKILILNYSIEQVMIFYKTLIDHLEQKYMIVSSLRKLDGTIEHIYRDRKPIENMYVEIITDSGTYTIANYFSICAIEIKNIDIYHKFIELDINFKLQKDIFINNMINNYILDDVLEYITHDEINDFLKKYATFNNISQFLIKNISYSKYFTQDEINKHIYVDKEYMFDGIHATLLHKRSHYQDILKNLDIDSNFQNIKQFYQIYNCLPPINNKLHRNMNKLIKLLTIMNKYDMVALILIKNSIETEKYTNLKHEIKQLLTHGIDFKDDILIMFGSNSHIVDIFL